MPEGQVLEFSGLTKRFGAVQAVDGLTARVEPGAVTGFLGPNGAGKTTTLRMLLGLIKPTTGTATIGGVPYSRLSRPLQTVGAVLEASSFHPGRSGANHLKVYARAAGLPSSQIDATLELVGLSDAAGRKVGGYSLGMRQRLGLAYALLGDPGVLVLDEPANGLDPEGIKWLRGFLQQLAREGRTVLVSSHLLMEVQQTADAVLILAAGRRVFNGSIGDLVDPSEQATIVDSEDRAGLVEALRAAGIESAVLRSGVNVHGAEPAEVGRAAAAGGIALTALQRRGPALEEVFLELVSGVRTHPSADPSYDSRAPIGDVPDAGAAGVAAVGAAVGMAAADAHVADDPLGIGISADPEAEIEGPVMEAPEEPAPAAEEAPESPAREAPESPAQEASDQPDPHAVLAEHLRPSAESDVPAQPEPAPMTGVTALAALGLHDARNDAAQPPLEAENPPDQGDPLAWIAAAESETVGRSAPEDADETDAVTPQDAAPPEPEWTTGSGPAGAAFAVASTGVIDVVPLGAASTAAEAPDDHSADAIEEEPADAAGADDQGGETRAEPTADEPESEPSGDHYSDPAPKAQDSLDGTDREGEADAEPDLGDEGDFDDAEYEEDENLTDQIRSAYVTHSAHAGEDEKTDSDVAADAFFAAFDTGEEPDAGSDARDANEASDEPDGDPEGAGAPDDAGEEPAASVDESEPRAGQEGDER